jgi:CheY-like chemotaxis protein
MEGAERPATLVVEDDDVVRLFLGRALEAIGLAVTSVATGGEALELIRTKEFGLLFADGLLPDMHGLDLLRAVICDDRGETVCVCLLSGTVRRGTTVRSGVSALAKPVRMADLAEHAAEMRLWQGSPRAERLAAIEGLREALLVDSD